MFTLFQIQYLEGRHTSSSGVQQKGKQNIYVYRVFHDFRA